MVNLTALAIWSIIFLAILAIISNTGPTAITNIENNMFLMNCPSPTIHVLPTVDSIDGFTVIYTLDYNSTHVNTVTVFNCNIDDITGNRQVSTVVYDPDEGFFSTFDNAFAWLGYIYSYVVSGLVKAGALLQIMASVLTPVNFDFVGYGITDLSGISLMFVILTYVVLYMVVGLWVYKSLNPMGGGD